jgi:hypothetical protein
MKETLTADYWVHIRPKKAERVIESSSRILLSQRLKADTRINTTSTCRYIGRHEVVKGNPKPLRSGCPPHGLIPRYIVCYHDISVWSFR